MELARAWLSCHDKLQDGFEKCQRVLAETIESPEDDDDKARRAVIRAVIRMPYWRDTAVRKHLDTLTQSSTVLAYTEEFNELADQFCRPSEAYFKARYLEGLKEYSSEIAALAELEDLQEAAIGIEQTACRKSQPPQAGRGNPKNTSIPICQICDDGSRHRHKNCPLIVEAKKMSKNNPAKHAPSPSLTEQRSPGYAVVVE
ncbi:hypothetical protein BDZ88DRAFT_456226 [Geranomyces variabilis]|nr:hypothetical protein BDZ88DRAFT_456226 [Geranomyces variabilis]KAJ3134301.1 hypothetical protein HDU90_005167 [Geranomyces variabilis]